MMTISHKKTTNHLCLLHSFFEDREDLVTALESIRQVTDVVNESVREAEERQKMMEVSLLLCCSAHLRIAHLLMCVSLVCGRQRWWEGPPCHYDGPLPEGDEESANESWLPVWHTKPYGRL